MVKSHEDNSEVGGEQINDLQFLRETVLNLSFSRVHAT